MNGGASVCVELSPDVRNRVLYEWNDTNTACPEVCVHKLFEAQATRTPDAIAVIGTAHSLTYRELNERSNQLAHYLREAGIGPESLVGVCLHRSPEMVIALLSVWKAGGAYVPIDPSYPQDRLQFMVSDAAVKVILTEERLRNSFGPGDHHALCLDTGWSEIATYPKDDPDSENNLSNLAYVMYTSGSTGKPKGAMILQRGLVNYLCWAIREYRLEPGLSVPVHSSISFDLTVTSLYPALLSGGKVEMLGEDVGAANLVSALRRQKDRNLVKITPAHLEVLSQQLSATELAGLTRVFVIGGENLPAESLRIWREKAPGTRLINEYGPTETVVGCSVYEVGANDPHHGPVPIGRPIANTQMYILDESLQPVAPGGTGEIYIGGLGVARGYFNRPELTAERFLQDPFRKQPDARMYKTGDLGRYRDDGVIEYLGRVDNQVKVRGYRIELGEIEAAVSAWDGTQSCAVLAREDSPGEKQLVAYIVLRHQVRPATDQLRKFLTERLPDYMVPVRFVYLEALPLTPNGKVDRKILPPPAQEDLNSGRERIQPRTATEKVLAALWMELLKLNDIGTEDDFFDLGGRSLLAIKVMSRVRALYSVELPPQTIFENPTIASFADVLDRAITNTDDQHRIEHRTTAGPLPVSVAQEQLWYLHQLNPDSPVYNVVDTIPLTGIYDAAAMSKALNALLGRHEILRTSYYEVDGQPLQLVSEDLLIDIAEFDLTSLAESAKTSSWNQIVQLEARKPFDLSRPPLLRACVVHHSAQDHKLLLTIHHIVVDEWSMEIVQRELRELYLAFSQGRTPSLANLPIQYSDFARWQRERLSEERVQKHLAYWKQELAGAPTTIELPLDKTRPAQRTTHGATEVFSVPPDLVSRLKSLGQSEHATLFMTLEASFAALLHRYTGQDDLLIGTPVSGRSVTETEDLIGCFLNTIVLRSQFADDMNFRLLLQQVRQRALGAYTHHELPFSHLVAEIAPHRDPSRSPLFQAMFVLHDTGGTSAVSTALGNHELGTGTSKFDLTLVLSEGDAGIDGLVEYSTDLWTPESIRRLCDHYVTLLDSIVRDPEAHIEKLELLTEFERKQLLIDWNHTDQRNPEQLLHQILEQQAARTPSETAVVFEGESLSYAELHSRANQLAHQLRELGAGPDVLIGLFVERSLDMMVGILGILKAGATYIPLDPAFPRDRLGYMVEDSQMPLLLTHRGLEKTLPVLPPKVLQLDSDWPAIACHQTAAPDYSGARSTQLAYVLYTSGSTGKPKGVAIPHSAIVNFLLSMRETPGFRASDIMLAVTTLSFDIAALELYLPLITGGSVVIANDAEVHDPRRLTERIQQSRCTVMQATPATYRALVHAGWKGAPGLKLLCGGEALHPDLAADLLARSGQLWNMYGPTETTVWSTVQRVTSASSPVPIGKPIANTQVFVLDRARNLVPIGATGELYIGGDGLARGYLHREELTSERFLPSPFAPDKRIYRTGDLAMWHPDGSLICLGRTDNQVKIRGFRIELGEIEAILNTHSAIRQCAVVVREDGAGDKKLVAFLEPSNISVPDPSELRAFLEQQLPSYMVPAAFVSMERLPLTPNGKIDRKALPGNVEVEAGGGTYVGPRDQLEQILTKIWSHVLKVKQIGITDNFFNLGGHSLLAVRLIIEIEKICHVRLPLATLLQAPTVAELAKILRNENWTPSWLSLVPICPAGSRPPLFLMHAHGGNTLEYHALANLLQPEQPVYALQSRGLDGRIRTGRSMEEMAAAYVEEIRNLDSEGPYFLGGFCFGGLLALEAAHQLTAAGYKVPLVVMMQTMHPRAMAFRPEISLVQRAWYRTSKRLDLELQNLSHRGINYFGDRMRHSLQHFHSRVAFALGQIQLQGDVDLSHLPTHHILEALAIEHSRAASKYTPPRYEGRVLLFRASTQLRGLQSDEYLGWKDVLTGDLRVLEANGHQQNLLLQPQVERLAAILTSQLLDAAQSIGLEGARGAGKIKEPHSCAVTA